MSGEQQSVAFISESEEDTQQLGGDLALALQVGDCVVLSGDLGAGKSTLARAIIRAIANDEELEVPSPTYTLEQVYETTPRIHHYDFYRLGSADEAEELGISDAANDALILIEWPQKALDQLPPDCIFISIEVLGGEQRKFELKGPEDKLNRLSRSLLIRDFLTENWQKDVRRIPFAADASARRYEFVEFNGETRILMDAPHQPDGPPIKDGKSYSEIAHLAEEVSAFAAIDRVLIENGFCAPKLFGTDLDAGLLLIEHLGGGQIIDEERLPIDERYIGSIEVLAHMHECQWPSEVALENGQFHHIAAYDHSVIEIETELLTDWYIPDLTGTECSKDQREAFTQIWADLSDRLQTMPQSLVLRDHHSPNIIWRNDKTGDDRVGLIDFQDALIGPESYDVASLSQDARVDVSEALENQLVDHYILVRKTNNPNFDEAQFRESCAIMAAQRATKILGIFVRLHIRDKKPDYRKHIPRMRDYLERSFRHPALKHYKEWFDRTIND